MECEDIQTIPQDTLTKKVKREKPIDLENNENRMS